MATRSSPTESLPDMTTDIDKTLPYTVNAEGFREATGPPYQYGTINVHEEEIRILVLQPRGGDKNARHNYLRCSFEVEPLASAAPFIAIQNGRGYRLLHELIHIDDKALLISTALEKFLRHLRKPDVQVRLWVRYVCLNQNDPEEMSKHWTREFVDKVYEKAHAIIDMPSTLNDLLSRDLIERSTDSRYKQWQKNWNTMPESLPLPKVYPIKLGKKPSNENPTDDYEYLPLDPVANEIRVIVVANDTDYEAPLILHLAHCPLGSEVAYHALSYTWGVETDPKEIIVNGQKILIRANLDAALRALRSPTHGVAIWADAICINQNDTAEKNRQLPRIGDILEKAVAVVCHVGEPDEHSDLALDLVKHLQQPFVRMDSNGHFEVGKPEKISPEGLPRHCAALYSFLMRPFFTRAWILQELALASNPVIACGQRRDTFFEQVDSAAYNLQDMLSRHSELAAKMKEAVPQLQEVSPAQLLSVRKLCYFRHLHSGGGRNRLLPVAIKNNAPGYLETAILSRDFQATVPHDKIFALWSVARDKQDFEFHMDYSKTYAAAFAEFAKAWALHSGSLDILGAAEYIHPAEQTASGEAVPSWCPDWSRPSKCSSLVRREGFRHVMMAYMDDQDGPIYSADGSIRQNRGDDSYFRIDGNELHCLGVILDSILGAATMESDPSNNDKYAGLLPATAEFCKEHDLNAYEDIEQALVAMIHGDVPAAWPKRQDNLENANDEDDGEHEPYVCIPYKPRTNWEQTPNASRHVPSYAGSYSRQEAWEAVCTIMRGRKPFVTEKGYVGLMPEFVLPDRAAGHPHLGLRLAILATCSVPVLLQERPDDEGGYTLLGTCFVQGWMESEILKEEMGCDSPAEFWEAMAGSEKLRIV